MTLDQLLAVAQHNRIMARLLTRRLYYRAGLALVFAFAQLVAIAVHNSPAFVVAIVGLAASVGLWFVTMNDLRLVNQSMRRNARELRARTWQR